MESQTIHSDKLYPCLRMNQLLFFCLPAQNQTMRSKQYPAERTSICGHTVDEIDRAPVGIVTSSSARLVCPCTICEDLLHGFICIIYVMLYHNI